MTRARIAVLRALSIARANFLVHQARLELHNAVFGLFLGQKSQSFFAGSSPDGGGGNQEEQKGKQGTGQHGDCVFVEFVWSMSVLTASGRGDLCESAQRRNQKRKKIRPSVGHPV